MNYEIHFHLNMTNAAGHRTDEFTLEMGKIVFGVEKENGKSKFIMSLRGDRGAWLIGAGWNVSITFETNYGDTKLGCSVKSKN